MAFEIIVLESHLINTVSQVSEENVVGEFVKMCKRFVWCDEFPTEYMMLIRTAKTIIYNDTYAPQPACMVILTGPITVELFDEIEARLNSL